jgi:hypothetical protein
VLQYVIFISSFPHACRMVRQVYDYIASIPLHDACTPHYEHPPV